MRSYQITTVPSVKFTPNKFTPTLGVYRPVSENLICFYTRVPSVGANYQEFKDIGVSLRDVVSLRADALLEHGYVSVTAKQADGTEHPGLVLSSMSVGIQWGMVQVTTSDRIY